MNTEMINADDAERGAVRLPKLGSINHLRITVTDISASLEFYSPIMNFMGYHLVERSTVRLAWARFAAHANLDWFIMSAASEKHRNSTHDRTAPGFHHLAWNAASRSDVDALYRLLVERGVTVLDAPSEYNYEPGYYALFFTDPDNLKLEFVHVPQSGSQEYWTDFATRRGGTAAGDSHPKGWDEDMKDV